MIELDEHSQHYANTFSTVAKGLLAHLVGQPIRFLEIGVYQGGTACRMLEELLTHPDSRYTGIDNRSPDLLEVARRNLASYRGKMELIEGDSIKAIPKLKYRYNVIYIDGDHRYEIVLKDLHNSWDRLLEGGIVILDDYDREDYGVRQATKEFLSTKKLDEYKILKDGYIFAFCKGSEIQSHFIYEKDQAKILLDIWPRGAEWFIVGGTADAYEAQTIAKVHPSLKYLGIEPNKELHAKQLRLNFPGILLDCALWSNDTELRELLMPGRFNPRASSVCRPYPSDYHQKTHTTNCGTVRVRTLDSLSEEYGPFNNAVLWIDIEYAELEALKGAVKLLEAGKILMINLETYDNLFDEINLFLAKRGMKFLKRWNTEMEPVGRQDVIFVRK